MPQCGLQLFHVILKLLATTMQKKSLNTLHYTVLLALTCWHRCTSTRPPSLTFTAKMIAKLWLIDVYVQRKQSTDIQACSSPSLRHLVWPLPFAAEAQVFGEVPTNGRKQEWGLSRATPAAGQETSGEGGRGSPEMLSRSYRQPGINQPTNESEHCELTFFSSSLILRQSSCNSWQSTVGGNVSPVGANSSCNTLALWAKALAYRDYFFVDQYKQ